MNGRWFSQNHICQELLILMNHDITCVNTVNIARRQFQAVDQLDDSGKDEHKCLCLGR